jgi:hypothetical protein
METKRDRRGNPRPVRIQLAHAGGGVWVALVVDRHGAELELITGSEREVLLTIRDRWPTLPVDRLPFAIETEGTNGHRVNPAGVPVRVALGHRGEGQWLAMVLDDRGAPLEAITGTRPAVLAAIHARWPDLPLEFVPFVIETENPAGIPHHAEVSYSGRGEYTAFVLDEQDRELVRIQADSPDELRALLAERYPGLPVTMVPRRNPAGGKGGGKEAARVTDRALRYRANAHPPLGDRRCSFCGSSRNVEVGHANGREEDNSRENKIWTCRACNVRCGNTLRAAGIGRLTRQFNPDAKGATSLAAWLSAVMSMKGESDAMSVPAAVALIRATSPEDRSDFAQQVWTLRRQRYGKAGRPAAVPF